MNVVLLIMQVPSLRKKTASVFFDLGSNSNFVPVELVRQCGFRGKQVNLSVTTLGGEDKNFIEVTEYTCSLVDVNSKTEKFEAYGMSTITGSVTQIISHTIRRLFPNLSSEFMGKGSVLIRMHPGKTSIGRLGEGGQIAGRYELQKGGCDRIFPISNRKNLYKPCTYVH